MSQVPAPSPYYKYHVFFCTNKRTDGRASCEDHGSLRMRAYAAQRIKELGLAGVGGMRMNTAGCLDRCSLGPVMVVYPDGVWYTWSTQADIDEIIAEHLQHHRIVERLRI